MAGHGGKREGAGRKPKRVENDLREVLAVSCPRVTRERIFTGLVQLAEGGDVQAAKLILSYMYGTPPSGDEMKLRELLEAELERIFTAAEKCLGAEDYARFRASLLRDSGRPAT